MKLCVFPSATLLLAAFFSTTAASAHSPTADGLQFFEQKIRPVLVQHCYSCHSVQAKDAKKLQGELYLDSAPGMLTGGESGPSIVRGKSAESLLLKALKYDGVEMPPAGKLPAEVIADFAKFIDMGAPDPRNDGGPIKAKREINLEEGRRWWSFQPLRKVKPPQTPTSRPAATPIDQFIVAAQHQQGVQGNKPTTKEKLIRRAYFDLIGLPPTPDQVEAFVQDTSPRAFEKVIDDLLARPQYGEKWARHWLDTARFAESGGYEFDGFRPGAYHYRDWVIRALNSDMPYDQFVRMQLAGDALSPDDFQAATASGFLVAGPYPGQITAKTVERIRYDQLDDMLMTIGGSMLGLTLGCVRCHDHKYDPLPQQDYYALAASLARTSHGTRSFDPDPLATEKALAKHQQELEPRVAALRKYADEELPKRFEAWVKAELPKQPETPRWQVLEPVTVDAERSWLKWQAGGVIAHDGLQSPNATVGRRRKPAAGVKAEQYDLTFQTHQKNITSLRLDAFTDKSLPNRGPGLERDGAFQLLELKITARPIDAKSKDKPLPLKLKAVFAAFEDKDQPLAHATDGKPNTAWVVRTTAKQDNAAIFELDKPLAGFAGGTELLVELMFRDLGLGRMRFSVSTTPNPATWAGDFAPQHLGEVRAILAASANKLPDTLRVATARWFSPFDEPTLKAFQAVRDHLAAEPRPPLTEVYTTIAGGQDVFLLRRGEVENKLGKAESGVLQVLWRGKAAPPSPAAEAVKPKEAVDPRLALADWMTNVDHGAGPLLARVMVNRLWQHHFGDGLVGTPNDFGAQGDKPSHPELLEWLASELVGNGWRLKSLHKQILLSAVYQQSHEVSADNVKRDPTNRYLWHFRPQRLDAERIRDTLLAVGGKLDAKMFGPSILDDTPRRSIYLRVKRSELIPMMTMFDAPEPTQSVGERISTTVPTQALAMMNSAFVRRQAENLAKRSRLSASASPAEVIDRAYLIAFSRLPTPVERDRMLGFITAQQSIVGGNPPTTFDAALVEACQVLLCLNEFIYID